MPPSPKQRKLTGDPTDSEVAPPPESDDEEAWGARPDRLTSDPVPLRKILAAEDLRDAVKKHVAAETKQASHDVAHATRKTASATAAIVRSAGRGVREFWGRVRTKASATLEAWKSKRDDVE